MITLGDRLEVEVGRNNQSESSGQRSSIFSTSVGDEGEVVS